METTDCKALSLMRERLEGRNILLNTTSYELFEEGDDEMVLLLNADEGPDMEDAAELVFRPVMSGAGDPSSSLVCEAICLREIREFISGRRLPVDSDDVSWLEGEIRREFGDEISQF